MGRRNYLIAAAGSLFITAVMCVAALAIAKHANTWFEFGLEHHQWWWGPLFWTIWIPMVSFSMFSRNRKTIAARGIDAADEAAPRLRVDSY